ncbi:MAG TPA: hypothetical protein VND64_14610 [Pirellulales bacterium]|nr:hypothetical protein [Pirellulales bacterium]
MPVSGTVTYNGNAVVGALVAFHPVDPNSGGHSALGTTDAAGKFTLQTPEGGTKLAKGAMVGDYQVAITLDKPRADTSTDPMAGSDLATMTDEQKMEQMSKATGISVPKVGGGQTPTGAAAGQTTQMQSELPAKYAFPKESGLTATVPAGGKEDFTFPLSDN